MITSATVQRCVEKTLNRVKYFFIGSPIYSKALQEIEGNLATKTNIGGEQIIVQTIEEIAHTGILQPNCLSFGLPKRLCVSIVGAEQQESYRNSGLIFTTPEKPDYISPADLIVFTKERSSNESFYENELLPQWETFLLTHIREMHKRHKSLTAMHHDINRFRQENNCLPVTRHDLRYNEAGFFRDIKIRSFGLYGDSFARKKAKELGLEYFQDARDAYESATAIAGFPRKQYRRLTIH